MLFFFSLKSRTMCIILRRCVANLQLNHKPFIVKEID
jgi:hypothetical protein